jgi:hypothetical protein
MEYKTRIIREISDDYTAEKITVQPVCAGFDGLEITKVSPGGSKSTSIYLSIDQAKLLSAAILNCVKELELELEE